MKPIVQRPVTPEIKKIAKRAADLYAAEHAERAFELVQAAVEEHNHARLWRLLARMRVFFGDEAGAAEILKHALPAAWDVGFWELAQAGATHGYAVQSEQHKLLYFPVRKCACTSMYNFMALIDGKTAQGEEIHDGQGHKLINFSSLRSDYEGYKTILVVREPIRRVRSFYRGNILKREHLLRDTGGKEKFYGLSTKPTYAEFLANFDAYRRTFITVRNHTDPLVAFAGKDSSKFDHIANVGGVSAFQADLANSLNIPLEPKHDMQSGTEQLEGAQEASLKDLYAEDYQIFGEYF